MDYETLAKRLGLNKTELKQALTHYSFYKKENEHKANGRLIFAGMFVFKGQLANILYNYFPGTGTQLQHILGNLFQNKILHQLFDKWSLKNKIRAGQNFDINAHKHIFVYAILGCISQKDETTQRRFIFKHLINNDTKHIFKHLTKNNDFEGQANFIAKHSFNKKLIIVMQLSDDELHKATVKFDDGTVICEAKSKSYRYARKKAIKKALKILSQITFDNYASKTNYIEREKKRIEQEKELRKKEIEERIAMREAQRKKRLELYKKRKQIEDERRRKAKAQAKKRKLERKAAAEKKRRIKLKRS